MTDVLNEEFLHLPDNGQTQSFDTLGPPEFDPALFAEADEDDLAEAPASREDPERLTLHTQSRLAGLAAFDAARSNAQHELTQIGASLASIMAAQHVGREFLDDSHADIRRSNELEILNIDLSAENRRLGDRVEKLEKLRARYDQLVEVLKRRETKLQVEVEGLRESLGSIRLQVVEARNANARAEFIQGELQTSLSAKTNEAERNMRESELLREKNVNLALDLDKALQKQTETRRRYEDLSAIHASESSLIAKMTAKLAAEEKEAARLQRLSDALEAKLVEANENVANASREMNEREELYQTENHALRGEIQTLLSRFQTGSADQAETAAEVTQLKARLAELDSEKQFAERKSAALLEELETERKHSDIERSHGERAKHGVKDQQVEAMRAQIEELTETVERLKRFEAMASKTNVDFPETFGASGKARAPFRPKIAPSSSV